MVRLWVCRLGLDCLGTFREVVQVLCGMRVAQAMPAAQIARNEDERVCVRGLGVPCDVMSGLRMATDTGQQATDISDRRHLFSPLNEHCACPSHAKTSETPDSVICHRAVAFPISNAVGSP